jgi:ketosteroid isomerase-like protein
MTHKAWIAITLGLGLLALAATSARPWAAADEVIAVTKAQWAAEIDKDFDGAMAILADDYTEFSADTPFRLDRDQLVRLAEARRSGPGALIAAEMTNEKVQVYGDTAVLTYNFVGISADKDGATENILAKSTRVYVNMDGNWMLVHANFAPVE